MIRLLIWTMAICLATSTSLFAQKRSAEDRAKKEAERITKELKLDATQAKKVEKLTISYAKKMKSLRQNGDRAKMREAFTQMRKEKDAEMKKILTKEQFKKYVEWLKKRQDKRGKGKKRRR